MSDRVYEITGTKGVQLSVLEVKPKNECKGVIQIFHGMGEHKMRYLNTAKAFAKAGFAVYVHDHRKHGKSVANDNQVGIFTKDDSWENVIYDCNIVTNEIKKEYHDQPLILLGHSMGSVIARKYISEFPSAADAAIIMGTLPPISRLKAAVPKFIAWIIRFFKSNAKSPFLAGMLNEPLQKDYNNPKTKFDWLTKDENVVKDYIDDDLCGYAYSPTFYIEFLKTMVDINRRKTILKTKDIPLLFISGDKDPVGENGEGVKQVVNLYKEHGYANITLKLIKDARHEVLNETNKAKTLQYVIDWTQSILLEINNK